jgi:hypothetical protein
VHTKSAPRSPIRADVEKYIGGVKLGMGTLRDSNLLVRMLTLYIAYNPRELSVYPKTWCRTLGPVVYEADNDSGGHFYATEKPGLLVRDLNKMFGKGGGAYGVVKGKNGYDDAKARL